MNRIDEIFSKHTPNTSLDDDDEGRFFMNMLLDIEKFDKELNNYDKNSDIYQHFKPLLESFLVRVFLSRLEKLTTLKITLGVLIMIAMRLDTPGIAVLLAYYLQYKLPKNTIVNIDIYSKQLFPFGNFSKKQLNDIWSAQKVLKSDNVSKYTCIGAPDNLIDYLEYWKKE